MERSFARIACKQEYGKNPEMEIEARIKNIDQNKFLNLKDKLQKNKVFFKPFAAQPEVQCTSPGLDKRTS